MSVKYIKSVSGKVSQYIFYGLLAYMPFHVFLSTWFGSSFGILGISKVIKEPVMILGFSLAVFASLDHLKKILSDNKLIIYLITLFGLISLLSVIVRNNELDAELLGMAYDTRFLIFFLYGMLLGELHGQKILRNATKTIIISGVSVAMLGILQVRLLPDTWLKNIGYTNSAGTPTVFYISPITKETERAFSTLKDPNSLGSYTTIIISLLLISIIDRRRLKKDVKKQTLGLAILFMCLYLTYSRSAITGLICGLFAFILLFPYTRQLLFKDWRKYVTLSAFIIIPTLTLYLLSGTFFFNNVILHDVEGKSVTSNTIRLDSYKQNIEKIYKNPLGYGVGTAGPVSFKNETKGAMIPENYYIQIALETGIIGMLVFMAIVVAVACRLFQMGEAGNTLATALLISLVSISVANLFNHIWSNEAIAYTWWGLAGIFLVIPRKKRTKSA